MNWSLAISLKPVNRHTNKITYEKKTSCKNVSPDDSNHLHGQPGQVESALSHKGSKKEENVEESYDGPADA